ncbi:MAG: 50S ribosomal protein L1 [Cardiobacteriaceae bacterium]|nr:50S ribosomal protein L1 [Cardiobacteriaceae bacterium]
MAKVSKRTQAFRAQVVAGKVYPVLEALSILKSVPAAKFVESVDVAINLGIDPRKSDQVVRGAAVLPNGTGKSVRVAVFAQGDAADAAKAAGADLVGMDELADEIKNGRNDFDVVIAEPAAMRVVGQLGQVLGPRGLMPNPKVGTVTPDVKTAVENAKAGQVRFRADKGGVVHAIIGKVNFSEQQLAENLNALIAEVNKLRPAAAKGVYFKKAFLSTTMGPGIAVDIASFSASQ